MKTSITKLLDICDLNILLRFEKNCSQCTQTILSESLKYCLLAQMISPRGPKKTSHYQSRLQVDWAMQECRTLAKLRAAIRGFLRGLPVVLVTIQDFIPFTCRQWLSTWNLRTCHVALTAVFSKTKYRILYDLR